MKSFQCFQPSLIRHFSGTRSKCLDMVSLLQSSIKTVQEKKETKQKLEILSQPKQSSQPKQKKAKQSFIGLLNSKYASKFKSRVSPSQIALINGFFYTTQAKLEWTTADFLDIPGERKRQELEGRLNQLSEKKLELKEIQADEDAEFNALQANTSHYDVLPEIVFLGKCNVGKSSLLNSLLTKPNVKEPLAFAFSSRRAGFTQTMNCFNIGKRFRLIDTPGYGVRGKESQGRQVMQYLQKRKQLRRVYLLVGATEGFSLDDFTIMDILVNEGVPFEIVFTKIDKLKSLSIVEKHIKESGVLKLPTEPNLIFTNSDTSKKIPKREGFGDLRHSIFDACGLDSDIRPLKIK